MSLADDAAVLATYDGPDGVAAGLREGTVVVESSTIDPETVRRVEPLVTAARRGAAGRAGFGQHRDWSRRGS